MTAITMTTSRVIVKFGDWKIQAFKLAAGGWQPSLNHRGRHWHRDGAVPVPVDSGMPGPAAAGHRDSLSRQVSLSSFRLEVEGNLNHA